LTYCNTTTLIYKPAQPFGTLKRHIIIVPENAEQEIGFQFWLHKVWNIAQNSGAKLIFYASAESVSYIQKNQPKQQIDFEFVEFTDWNDFLILARDFLPNDNLVIILSRKDKPSYHGNMKKIPKYLNRYFKETSYILIYPVQEGVADNSQMDLKNPTFMEPINKLDSFGRGIARIFLRK